MSDVQPPTDDELVSAYLDGEATPDERALVEGSPDLRRQVEVLRQVSTAVGDAPAADAGRREQSLAAALAVFDAEVAPTIAAAPSAPATPPVSDLDAARRRRQARRLTVLGAAAAIVLVVLIAGGLAVRSSRTSTDSLSVAAAPSTKQPFNAPSPQGSAVAGGGGREPSNKSSAEDNAAAQGPPPTTVAPDTAEAAPSAGAAANAPARAVVYVGDLGALTPGRSFRDALVPRLDALDSATAGQAVGAGTPPAATQQQLASCDTRLRATDPELAATPKLSATATLDGQRSLILAYELRPDVSNANGAYRAFAVTPDCSVLDTQTV